MGPEPQEERRGFLDWSQDHSAVVGSAYIRDKETVDVSGCSPMQYVGDTSRCTS